MTTRAEYLQRPRVERLDRLARTPDDVQTLIKGAQLSHLAAKPGAESWSALEAVCHLRDIEELCILRFHLMLAMDEPLVFVAGAPPADPARWGIKGAVPFPLDPTRWAVDRQYLRQDPVLAFEAFARRRREVLTFLEALTPEQWRRGSIHPEHGRFSFDDWTGGMAAHDDMHLAQLGEALEAAR